MKIIFDKEKTKQKIAETARHNHLVKKKWLILAGALIVSSSVATAILSDASGKHALSIIVSAMVFGLLIPSICRDFIPSFKFKSIHGPDLMYAFMMDNFRGVYVRLADITDTECTLHLKVQVPNGGEMERTFHFSVIRKEDVSEEVIDLMENVVYLPKQHNN